MTPTFAHQGGKVRLRNWLIGYFPQTGNNYIEAFAGRGNVFFKAKEVLNFNNWQLNDLYTSEFFEALISADLDLLPDKVDRDDFKFHKEQNNVISKIIEPRITFAGKGYKHGFSMNLRGHVPYKGINYRKHCERAKELLKDVKITSLNYENLDFNNYKSDDFIYFDPPYYETKACYPNINHLDLINILNKANYKWGLSGYDNELYNNNLKYKNKFEKIRNAEIKGANLCKKVTVMETLWLNY